MRYNFHEQLGKLKASPKYVLPEDINAPIHEYLEKRGLSLTSKKLGEYEKHARYGLLVAARKGIAASRIEISIASGMVGEIKELHYSESGDECLNEEFTIKNANLDKTNLNKKVSK